MLCRYSSCTVCPWNLAARVVFHSIWIKLWRKWGRRGMVWRAGEQRLLRLRRARHLQHQRAAVRLGGTPNIRLARYWVWHRRQPPACVHFVTVLHSRHGLPARLGQRAARQRCGRPFDGAAGGAAAHHVRVVCHARAHHVLSVTTRHCDLNGHLFPYGEPDAHAVCVKHGDPSHAVPQRRAIAKYHSNTNAVRSV